VKYVDSATTTSSRSRGLLTYRMRVRICAMDMWQDPRTPGPQKPRARGAEDPRGWGWGWIAIVAFSPVFRISQDSPLEPRAWGRSLPNHGARETEHTHSIPSKADKQRRCKIKNKLFAIINLELIKSFLKWENQAGKSCQTSWQRIQFKSFNANKATWHTIKKLAKMSV